MKKPPSLSVLLLSGILVFTACKKSNDNSPVNSSGSKIVGSWKATFVALDSNDNKTMETYEKITVSSYELLTFAANGTFTDTVGSGSSGFKESGNYSINGDRLTFNWVGASPTEARIFQLDDVNLVLMDTDTRYFWLGYVRQ